MNIVEIFFVVVVRKPQKTCRVWFVSFIHTPLVHTGVCVCVWRGGTDGALPPGGRGKWAGRGGGGSSLTH